MNKLPNLLFLFLIALILGAGCQVPGAGENTNDESTAFGSEFEQTTATRSHPNDRASEPSVRGRDGESVPGEVAILCQEIYEV